MRGLSLAVASGSFALVMLLRLVIVVASLVGEHGFYGTGVSVVSTHGLIVVALGLWSRGSTVGVHRLSCSVACEMLLLP